MCVLRANIRQKVNESIAVQNGHNNVIYLVCTFVFLLCINIMYICTKSVLFSELTINRTEIAITFCIVYCVALPAAYDKKTLLTH